MNTVQRTLSGALALTVIAAYFAPAPESVVAPTLPSKAAAEAPLAVAASGEAMPEVLAIRPRSTDGDMPSIFSAQAPVGLNATAPPVAQSVQPSPAVVVAEPPPPQAPPVTFKAFGRYVSNGKTAVFIQNNDQNTAVGVGDRIGDLYVVEKIEDRVVTVLYTPLNQRQTLEIGAAP